MTETWGTEIVATVLGKPVSRATLTTAFNWVASKANWKYAIRAEVMLTDFEKALVAEAVTFFTGSVATFKTLRKVKHGVGKYKVIADGYYATIGA